MKAQPLLNGPLAKRLVSKVRYSKLILKPAILLALLSAACWGFGVVAAMAARSTAGCRP